MSEKSQFTVGQGHVSCGFIRVCVCVCVFVASSISFISILEFLEYRSFASLGKFIPRYFILFEAVVNGTVSLISLSELFWLVYINIIDLCVLILYPTTLLNSLLSSIVFW